MYFFLLCALTISGTPISAFDVLKPQANPFSLRHLPTASARKAPLATRQRSSNVRMMPIGVPKVAYRVPGSQEGQWVEIYNRLYRERITFLGQEIDDEICNQLMAVMLYMDSEDKEKPIYMYINSPGGSVIAGLALYDTMEHIRSHVITVNVGLAASMASFILAAGERGYRLALPHSRVMIHQPMGGSEGQAEDIKVEANQIMKIKESLVTMYSQMTGQTRESIIKALDRDNFMSAKQAMEYGLLDNVLTQQQLATPKLILPDDGKQFRTLG